MRFLLLLLIFTGTALRAQEESFSIAGHVVDGSSGQPLARAAVSLEAISPEEEGAFPGREIPGGGRRFAKTSPPAIVVTGADGVFRFPGLPEGRYHLSASRRGYRRANFEEHADFYAAVICGPRHPEAAALRFSLLPLGSIRGTVLDSTGDPVEAATVQLYMQSTDGSGAVRVRQTSSLRHGSSRFFFGDLAPGTYFLAVTGTPWFAVSEEAEGAVHLFDVAYPATFFSGAASTDAAQPILLRSGETVQANFNLHAVPAVHVKVASGEGNQILQLPQIGTAAFDGTLPVSSGWVGRAVQTAGGMSTTLTASVAPGTYMVQSGTGERAMQLDGDATLDRPSDAQATTTLSGKIAMADGSALPTGLRVQLVPDSGGGRRFAGLGRAAPGFGLNRRPVDLPLAADGSLAASAVTPGRYRLQPRGGAALSVTGVAASGAETAADGSLVFGTDPVMVAATLASADRAVSGRVLTAAGQPEAGVMVLLVPEAPLSPTLIYQQESDSDGTWTIYGVVPGKYQVLAIRDGWDLTWKQAAVLTRYLGEAVEVVVSVPGETALPKPVLAQAR